jgi:glycosyltransferase involved in cell wall biosynthesis
MQTYQSWECIIVDDGSTDNTEEIVQSYCAKDFRFQFFKRPIHLLKGPNACRNYGFEKSKGEFIQWFDSDDLYFSHAFETYIRAYKSDSDAVVAKIERVDNLILSKINENKIESNNLIDDYLIGNVAFYVCGPLWRRSFLSRQDQLFDEKIMNLDDWDFNLRMLYQNPKIEYINSPLIQYRIHSESLAHEISKLNHTEISSELKAREIHLKLITNNKKANTKVFRRFIKDRCKYFFRESIIKNDVKRFYYLKQLLKRQLILNDYNGIIKTLFGFVFFSIFRKGYKFLK